MQRSHRRLLILLVTVPTVVAAGAVLYMWGMEAFEGKDRSFWQSLEWSAETLSTTGYGADSAWNHPLMVMFVSGFQLLGVVLVFLVFPVYLIPFLEERFEERLPRKAAGLKDHVIVLRYGPTVDTLLEEMSESGLPTVVIETEEPTARALMERGYSVVYAENSFEALENASPLAARALIANGSDEENAALIVAARQMGYAGEILALVEAPLHRTPMTLAGADRVFTPRHVLGAALAARASDKISPTVAGIQALGEHLHVREIRIEPGSSLAGKTLAELDIGRRTGLSVIGQWIGGELMALPQAETSLEPGAIAVVVGSEAAIEEMHRACGQGAERVLDGPFIVGGYGEVGSKVVDLLNTVGEKTIVVDRRDIPGVDVVGDLLDPKLADEIGLERSRGVILALDSDAATLFATVIIKDLAAQVPVIARVNDADNIDRIHLAGAEFALAISQVAGQILARRLLGKEAVSIDPELKILRVSSRGLEGRNPAELNVRQRTGCSVVAAERNGSAIVQFYDDFRFEAGDDVYVCGANQAIRRYLEEFPQK